ncbi:MAG: polymerase subunit sigma-24 [Frankiales bacterium]|nr:polymerase subunit sigma-24 [Frankiales bacterium]
MQTPAGSDNARLEAAFRALAPRVHAYALRHTDVGSAQDVVAETFAIAARRMDQLPDEPLPWLLVVARNVIANLHRKEGRLARAQASLRMRSLVTPSADTPVGERLAMAAALDQLSDKEREAVLLIAWDGLTRDEAASVAGCTSPAFGVRLHRARRKLHALLADVPDLPITATVESHA